MQQWKYLVLDLALDDAEWTVYAIDSHVIKSEEKQKLTEVLRKLGEEGWELICSSKSTETTEALFFKQAIEL